MSKYKLQQILKVEGGIAGALVQDGVIGLMVKEPCHGNFLPVIKAVLFALTEFVVPSLETVQTALPLGEMNDLGLLHELLDLLV